MRVLIEGHLLHIAAGPCLTWDNGGPVMHQTWVETGSAPMGGVLGGLDPSPFNGIPRGLGLAVQNGKMTVDEAVGFIEDLLNSRRHGRRLAPRAGRDDRPDPQRRERVR